MTFYLLLSAFLFLPCRSENGSLLPKRTFRPIESQGCTKPASCVTLENNPVCFGTSMPYKSISLNSTGFEQPYQIFRNLTDFEALKSAPKCWDKIQPLLCAAYFPPCTEETMALIPSQICNAAVHQCKKVLPLLVGYWPSLLNCANEDVFSPECHDYVHREIPFQTKGSCHEPLVQTFDENSYFFEFSECGMQCESPEFTPTEYAQVSEVIRVIAGIALACCLLAVLTFAFDQPSDIYNIILCWMFVWSTLSLIGWLFQFSPLSPKETIACRSNGTRRISEPGSGTDHIWCPFNFTIVYGSMIAALVWDVVFSFAISMLLVGRKEELRKKNTYFQITSVSIMVVLIILALSLNCIEGDSLLGICYVSQRPSAFISFVYLPLLLRIVLTTGFLTYGIIQGHAMKKEGRSHIKKILLYYFIRLLMDVIFLGLKGYELQYQAAAAQSMKDYVVCSIQQSLLNVATANRCSIPDRPGLLRIYIELICRISPTVLPLILLCNNLVWKVWKKIFLRVKSFCRPSSEEDDSKGRIRMKVPRVIAKSYANRKDLEANGHISISIESKHGPAGFADTADDVASEIVSQTLLDYLPRLLQRRNGLDGPEQLGLELDVAPLDSDISQSVLTGRFSSIGSRQPSMTSINSVTYLRRLRREYKRKKTKRKLVPGLRRRSSTVTVSGATSRNSSIVLPAVTREGSVRSSRRLRLYRKTDGPEEIELDVLAQKFAYLDLSSSGTPNTVAVQTSPLMSEPRSRLVTSSTQTDPVSVMPCSAQPLRHLEPNVILRPAAVDSSEETSSVPSSYIHDKENMNDASTERLLALKTDRRTRETHNRGRRGAVIGQEAISLPVDSSTTS